jgi:hypothetical protein
VPIAFLFAAAFSCLFIKRQVAAGATDQIPGVAEPTATAAG